MHKQPKMWWIFFVTWWRFPRMVVWCLFITLSWTLIRLPFARVYFLPSVAEFLPGFVLVPLAGIYAGPAGVTGILIGTLLGDALTMTWSGMTGFRCLAFTLGSLYAMVLWPAGTSDPSGADRPPAFAWKCTIFLRFLLLGIPICLTVSAWISLGGSVQRLYPFAYLVGLNLMSNLLFYVLISPAAFWLLSVEWAPRYGNWREVMAVDSPYRRSSWGRNVLIWSGGISACFLGFLFSAIVYDVWPTSTTWMGRHTGAWVTAPVILSLFAQILGLAISGGDISNEEPQPTNRVGAFYLPPIKKG